MRRTIECRRVRHVVRAVLFVVGAVGLTGSAVAETPNDLCLDQRIRHTAAEAIGSWSHSYPFSRVIIGNDGQFGDVVSPQVQEVGDNFVVCLASYRLVKVGSGGTAYTVSLDHFTYRVTAAPDGYRVALPDLPLRLDGTGLDIRDLIARFSVNGRPYADILEDNRRRIKARGDR